MLTNAVVTAWLIASAAAAGLKVAKIGSTPDGTTRPIRGWNSWGLQAGGYLSDFKQQTVQPICDRMATDLAGNYQLCGLDSGWSVGDHGDDNGRILYDSSRFDLPNFARHLHGQNQLLGVYVVPGAFIKDYDNFGRCYLKYDHPSTQAWFDSNAKQFADWGVDYIKLDFMTPGSPEPGTNLRSDSSGEVIGWQKAIKKTGKKITLSISWKLDRSRQYFDIWRANADSMRVDQDIQTYKRTPFVSWGNIIRTLQNYREWINAAISLYDTIGTHPNLDTMYVANSQDLTGLTYDQRKTVFIHWIGTSAELNLGDDLTKPDAQGVALLKDKDALSAADFTGNYPMQPRNPGSGGSDWKSQNAWISGPSPSGEFIAVLANYDTSGTATVSASLSDLGVSGSYSCFDIFAKTSLSTSSGLSATLKGGQSVMYRCTRGSSGGTTTTTPTKPPTSSIRNWCSAGDGGEASHIENKFHSS
ncbi:glycoside hydrolase family 27 [Purpureocillium lavendulum]|uniref:alpha-galactosidase n=1 Tax=Purpureocillium lavendulum TaxID=1247861 RepID=A0AB34FPX4_9HYPO|nr:glycoside hydrolase family 27 [Purpureocillium lavendulum]